MAGLSEQLFVSKYCISLPSETELQTFTSRNNSVCKDRRQSVVYRRATLYSATGKQGHDAKRHGKA